jgi:hypothetical protein
VKKWLLLLLVFPLTLFAKLFEDGDFQIWNTDAISIRLSPRSSFYGDIEFRYGDDVHKLYYKHIHLQLDWTLNRYFSIAPGFRFTWLRLNDKWVKENDPLIIFTLYLVNSRSLVVSNRCWFQYRNLPKELGGKHRILYRNRFQMLFPWKMGSSQINPYISDEIFVQKDWGFFENRAIIGALIPRSERAYFDFYYMYLSTKDHERKWVQSNVFGAGVQFYF